MTGTNNAHAKNIVKAGINPEEAGKALIMVHGRGGSAEDILSLAGPDPHIPVERVYATINILEHMHASVTGKIYDNMGHTISQDEIDFVNKMMLC